MSAKHKVILEPMTYTDALKLLSFLIDSSRMFKLGGRAFIGRFKTSYENGKIIERKSIDNQVEYRFDYDLTKGVHINWEDYRYNPSK